VTYFTSKSQHRLT